MNTLFGDNSYNKAFSEITIWRHLLLNGINSSKRIFETAEYNRLLYKYCVVSLFVRTIASLLNSSPASSPIVYYTAVFRHWCSVVTQHSSPALKVRLNHGYVKSVQNSRKLSLEKYSKSKYDQFSAIKLFASGNSKQPYALNSKFQSLSVERGFWIPIVSGIADSLSCIPDSKAQESGLHKQNFLRFRIPQGKIFQIPELKIPYSGRKRIFFL